MQSHSQSGPCSSSVLISADCLSHHSLHASQREILLISLNMLCSFCLCFLHMQFPLHGNPSGKFISTSCKSQFRWYFLLEIFQACLPSTTSIDINCIRTWIWRCWLMPCKALWWSICTHLRCVGIHLHIGVSGGIITSSKLSDFFTEVKMLDSGATLLSFKSWLCQLW